MKPLLSWKFGREHRRFNHHPHCHNRARARAQGAASPSLPAFFPLLFQNHEWTESTPVAGGEGRSGDEPQSWGNRSRSVLKQLARIRGELSQVSCALKRLPPAIRAFFEEL